MVYVQHRFQHRERCWEDKIRKELELYGMHRILNFTMICTHVVVRWLGWLENVNIEFLCDDPGGNIS